MNVNKCKLSSIITPWGEIMGDINDQKDLIELIQSRTGVTMEEVQAWVESQGYLTEHQDISNLATKEEVDEVEDKIPSLDGYATEEWVEGKGYLTEHQPLKTINGEEITGEGNIEIAGGGVSIEEVDDEIESKLTGYATEQWVEDKGYLTEHQDISNLATKDELDDVEKSIPDLTGYATEKYVSDNYVEASTFDKNMDDVNVEMKHKLESGDLKTINGESIVGTGDITITGGGLTPEERQKLDPLFNPKEGVMSYKKGIDAWRGKLWNEAFDNETPAFPSDYYAHLFNIDGKIYYIDTINGTFYEYQQGTEKPGFFRLFSDEMLIGNNNVLWKDKTGRMWLGTSYGIEPDKEGYPSGIQEFNLGGEYLGNYNRCNIVEMPNNIYMIGTSKAVYRFNEGSMRFVDTGVSTTSWTTFNSKLGTNTPKFTQYMFEIDGNKVLVGGTSSASSFRFRLTETQDAESGEYNLTVATLGTTTYFPANLRHGQNTVYPQGSYIHKNADGQYFYLQGAYITKLTRTSATSGVWQTSQSTYGLSYGWSGVENGDQFLGACTQIGYQIFNASDNEMYSGWEYNEYATKEYVDSILGSLDYITNQILS